LPEWICQEQVISNQVQFLSVKVSEVLCPALGSPVQWQTAESPVRGHKNDKVVEYMP